MKVELGYKNVVITSGINKESGQGILKFQRMFEDSMELTENGWTGKPNNSPCYITFKTADDVETVIGALGWIKKVMEYNEWIKKVMEDNE